MNNKNILILGGTGFVGTFLKNILSPKNSVITIGTKGNFNYWIGKKAEPYLSEIISKSDVVIFCSWDFKARKKDYLTLHLNSVNEIINICEKHKTSFLFVSTLLANKSSKSLYNKAKFLCEQTTLNHNHSILKLSVVKSDLQLSGNLYLKLSKLPSIFGYKIMLKPNKKKFIINDDLDILKFFNSFKFNSINKFNDQKKEFVSLTDVLNNISNSKTNYIFINWIFAYYLFKILNIFGLQTRINTDSILSIWGE